MKKHSTQNPESTTYARVIENQTLATLTVVAVISVGAICVAGCGGGDDFTVGSSIDDAGADANADEDAIGAEVASETSDATLPPPSDSTIDTLAIDDTTPSETSPVGDATSVDATSIDASPLDAGPPPPKRVFVTSAVYKGDLGGLAGADAKCQALANDAKLGGVYKAWLSDSTTPAKSRLSHATVDYVLVDGTVVANGWIDLTSGSLIHAIDMTEKKTAPSGASLFCEGGQSVRTNTSAAGGSWPPTNMDDCGKWTRTTSDLDAGGGSYWGLANAKSAAWTTACGSWGCGVLTSLYCVEQ